MFAGMSGNIEGTRDKDTDKSKSSDAERDSGSMMVQRHITVQIGQRVQAKPGIRRLNKYVFSSTRKNDLVAFKVSWLKGNKRSASCLCDNIQLQDHTLIYQTRVNQMQCRSIQAMAWMRTMRALESEFEQHGLLPNARWWKLLKQQYDVVAGKWWPKVNRSSARFKQDGSIPDFTLYQLGMYDRKEYDRAMIKYRDGKAWDEHREAKAFRYSALSSATVWFFGRDLFV